MNQALPIVLRGAASFGLLVLAATGCSLIVSFDPEDQIPLPAQNKYHCEAEVIDQFDLRTTVYNYDDPGHEGVVEPQCFVFWEDLGVDDLGDIVDAWHRWLDDAIAADGWCIVEGTISCAEAGPLGDETCPAVTLPAEPRVFCPQDALPCCIRSAPSQIDFEGLLTAAGMDNRTPVGFEAGLEPSGTLENRCDRDVSIRPQGLLGESPDDFEFLHNTCVVPEPPLDHPDGLTLSPAGTPGGYCTYQLRFTPSAGGVRRARMGFVQADTSACTSSDMPHFSGRGRAGVLSGAPDELCLGLLLDGRCVQSSFDLTNDGVGIVTVETIDASGNFELLSPATLELGPRESATVTVGWCAGFAGDIDDDGTLTIVSNATEGEILVSLARRTAGCL